MEEVEKRVTEVPREGLKDLLEHVRLVHFTMLVVGLVLLTASMRDSRSSVERARRDWEDLKKLMPNVKVVKQQVREAYSLDKDGWRRKIVSSSEVWLDANVFIDTKPAVINFRSVEMARGEQPVSTDPSELVRFVWRNVPLMVSCTIYALPCKLFSRGTDASRRGTREWPQGPVCNGYPSHPRHATPQRPIP